MTGMREQRPVAIVTGAARGIGLAIARSLAGSGFDIVAADVPGASEGEVRQAVEAGQGRCSFVEADISDLSGHAGIVEAAVGGFGRLDCLVNNAGIGAPVRGDLLELAPEHFDRVMAVNLRGAVFLSQQAARAMLDLPAVGRRSIVNITSVSAGMASPERPDYCMSKAALSMWTKNLALRLAPEGIDVFEVRPGIIRTGMTEGVSGKYDRLIEGGLVPARRWGEAEDVGMIVAALASGSFAFATGSVINADGALSVPRL